MKSRMRLFWSIWTMCYPLERCGTIFTCFCTILRYICALLLCALLKMLSNFVSVVAGEYLKYSQAAMHLYVENLHALWVFCCVIQVMFLFICLMNWYQVPEEIIVGSESPLFDKNVDLVYFQRMIYLVGKLQVLIERVSLPCSSALISLSSGYCVRYHV